MRLFYLILLFAATFAAASRPTVYFIRHGEKQRKGDGLNSDGVKRAQCLRRVFGAESDYHITHIMAQRPKKNGKQKRPYDTVKPLAKDLGLQVDTTCRRDDIDCVLDMIDQYTGKGNILICWEHDTIRHLIKALGAKRVKKYPDDAFNLIYTVPPQYRKVASITSEKCNGLD